MQNARPRHRFEITLQCQSEQVKHVCAAHDESEAVERMMRSYAKLNPELIHVKHLGALPVRLRQMQRL